MLSSFNVSGLTTFNNKTTCLSSLNVSGVTILNIIQLLMELLSLKNDIWHQTNDNIYRLYCASGSTTFICSGGIATDNNFIASHRRHRLPIQGFPFQRTRSGPFAPMNPFRHAPGSRHSACDTPPSAKSWRRSKRPN